MKVTTKTVINMSIDAGLPESLIDRHIDALCKLALDVKKHERHSCIKEVRKWERDLSPSKGMVSHVLEQ